MAQIHAGDRLWAAADTGPAPERRASLPAGGRASSLALGQDNSERQLMPQRALREQREATLCLRSHLPLASSLSLPPPTPSPAHPGPLP